jgi:hypothetical protein
MNPGADVLTTPLGKTMAGAVLRGFLDVFGGGNQTMVILVQGAMDWRIPSGRFLISTGNETISPKQVSSSVKALLKLIEPHGKTVLFSGRPWEIPLQAAANPMARLVRAVKTAQWVSLWEAARYRGTVVTRRKQEGITKVFNEFGIKIADITDSYTRSPTESTGHPLLSEVCGHMNIPALRRLLRDPKVHVGAGLDHHNNRLLIWSSTATNTLACVLGTSRVFEISWEAE